MSGNNNQRLLEGEVMDPPRDDAELNRQRELNRTLTRELHDALEENERLRKRVAIADAPIVQLRERLAPFYQLLQAIFGDIDAIAPDAPAPSPAANKNTAVWEAWKSRLGGSTAKGIDALLVHGDLNTQQLAIATGLDRQTITNTVVFKLNKAGLLNKNGGRFSLKQL